MVGNPNALNVTLSTGRNLPPPQDPFVDPKTGVLSNSGNLYILGLINQLTTAIPTLSVALGLKAQGATQATALQLTAQWNEVTTQSAGNTGVLLTLLQAGQSQTVFNQSGNNINVWPPPGVQIDALGVNVPFVLANGARQTFDFLAQFRSGD